MACDWNVEPIEPRPESRREARSRKRANKSGDALHGDLVTARSLRRRPTLGRAFAAALALTVHLFSLGIAVSGVVLIVVTGFEPVAVILGVWLIAFSSLFIPRPWKLGRKAVRVERAEAQVLYGAVDAIAARIDAPAVDLIVLHPLFIAGAALVGWHRRRVLVIGLPLWWTLDAEEKAAVLAHELAHFVNGDQRRGLLVGSAIHSLSVWEGLVPTREAERPSLLGWIVLTMFFPVVLFLGGLKALLIRASASDHQRGEYLADALMTRVVPASVAVSALRALLLDGTVWRALQRAARSADAVSLGHAARAHRTQLPDHELERLRRVSIRHGHAVDSSHPPTHLRIAFLEQGAVDAERTGEPIAIPPEADAELASFAKDLETVIRSELQHFSMA